MSSSQLEWMLNIFRRLIIMPSIFKTKNHKASKPSSLIHSTSGISYGVDVLRGPTRKLRKTSRGSTTGRFDSTIMSMSSTGVGSNSFASNPPLSHRPSIGNADLVSQPNHFTTFVSQTSASPNERPPIPTSTTDPGTERHNREILPLDVPPSTPLSQDSIPAIFVSEVQVDCEANSMMEGITYDAILASALYKNLGMMEGTKYLDIPATRTPPNSPTAIQEGGFGSLMGVSMAIMQGSS
jgi:hypothetical protein